MPIKYKMDVLQSLKNAGYNTNRIRKEKLFSESTLQAFRENELVALKNIAKICELLDCNVEDVIYYEKDAGVLKTKEVMENID